MQFAGFDWDSRNLPKCLKHGVWLEQIEALFAGDVFIASDETINDERRIHAFGNGAERWIFCAFTWRGRRIRPVSVRFMHEKEIRRYVEEISKLED